MKIIAGLESGQHKEEDQDMFGANDNDWEAYKDIQKDTFQENDEEDQQALVEVEELLADFDPSFNSEVLSKEPGLDEKAPVSEDY